MASATLTDRATLPTLLARLESEPPSRELGAELGLALGACRYEDEPASKQGGATLRLLVPTSGELVWVNPLTSLDAAVELCERIHPDAYWEVGRAGNAMIKAGAPDGSGVGEVTIGEAPTPALALVIATVKALIP